MKFTLNSLVVQSAIKPLGPIINFDHPTLGLRQIVIAYDKDKKAILFKGFNDHTLGVFFVPLETGDFDCIAVNAKKFFGVISNFNGADVKFELKDSNLHLVAGKSKYKLPILDDSGSWAIINEFDHIFQETMPVPTSVFNIGSFCSNVNQVAHCAFKSTATRANKDGFSNWSLQHIAINSDSMVACDGYKAAILATTSECAAPIIMHNKVIESIANLDWKANVQIGEYGTESKRLVVQSEFFMLVSILNNVDYQLDAVVQLKTSFDEQKERLPKIVMNPDQVALLINRIIPLADKETHSIQVVLEGDNQVKFIVANNYYAEEAIEYTSSQPITREECNIDGRTIVDFMKACSSEESIIWYFGEEGHNYFVSGNLLQFCASL